MATKHTKKRDQLSLSWLHVFRHVANSGSIQRAADVTELSISTVSYQLKCLEGHLGVQLLDHTRRPMTLTARGRAYQRYVEEVLELLEASQTAVHASSPEGLRQLSFGIIDDFENDIGPEIARALTTAYPSCRLTSYTRTSQEILDLLENRTLDFGIATQPIKPVAQIDETPFLKDPFVLAVPKDFDASAEDFVAEKTGLAFLSYNRMQIMGSLITAQLTRLRLPLSPTCEFDGTPSIMALVAEGHGWAITTATNYARSARFKPYVKLLPFPRKAFARTISMFVAEPLARRAAERSVELTRKQLTTDVIEPVLTDYPWLDGGFRLIGEPISSKSENDP